MLALRPVRKVTRLFAVRQRKAFILALLKEPSRIIEITYDLCLGRRPRSFVPRTVGVVSMIAIKNKVDVCLIHFANFVCLFK